MHHTADASDERQLERVNEYHKERMFPVSSNGYYVGYHYLIEKDGTIVETRKWYDEGAHTIGENLSSLGVAMAGNFDTEYPTDEQQTALGVLCIGLMARFGLAFGNILPHRHYKNTSCYGSNLPDDWASQIAQANEHAPLIHQMQSIMEKAHIVWPR